MDNACTLIAMKALEAGVSCMHACTHKRNVVVTISLLFQLHGWTVEMYGDALKEFLVPPRALYSSQRPVYLGSYRKQRYFCNSHVSNIQLKQHTFGHNNITVFTIVYTQVRDLHTLNVCVLFTSFWDCVSVLCYAIQIYCFDQMNFEGMFV